VIESKLTLSQNPHSTPFHSQAKPADSVLSDSAEMKKSQNGKRAMKVKKHKGVSLVQLTVYTVR
jgi:hypothetical protein